MAYDDLGFDFVQMLREGLVPPKQDVGRTCDCPIVFEEDPELVTQVHRYDCPHCPSTEEAMRRSR
jgi:hypothetical protein